MGKAQMPHSLAALSADHAGIEKKNFIPKYRPQQKMITLPKGPEARPFP